MNKQITDSTAADAIKESRAALRGVNSHVATILQHNDFATALMRTAAEEIRTMADEMGGVQMLFWDHNSGRKVSKSVKKELHAVANKLLEGAAK